MDTVALVRLLENQRYAIVKHAAEGVLQEPFVADCFPALSPKRMRADIDADLAALNKALRYHSSMLLEDHLVWRRRLLLEQHFSTGMLRQAVAHLWAAVAAHAPEEAMAPVNDYIALALQALVYPKPELERIVAAHNQLAEDVVAVSYDAQWDWQSAYRGFGRARMVQDAWWCIDYLIDTLGCDNPALLQAHARRMRDQAIGHGLTTLHMQQLLWFLAEIAKRRFTPSPIAQLPQMINLAVAALDYDHPSCRALLAGRDAVIAAVAEQLVAHKYATRREYAAFEAGWYVSYLYDCLAKSDAASLCHYTDWMRQGLETIGRPIDGLVQLYVALEQALQQHLPAPVAQEATVLLHAAKAATREPWQAAAHH